MPQAGATSTGGCSTAGQGEWQEGQTPTLVPRALPCPGAHRRGMSSAGPRHGEVPGLWQGEDKAAVGGNLCCPELPALTAPLCPAGFSDELQRQVRFVLLRPLQVGLSLSQVCPGGARLAGRVCPVVIWERGLPRAWATPGATPVTLQHPSLISPCKKETNVPCSGGAGWQEGH